MSFSTAILSEHLQPYLGASFVVEKSVRLTGGDINDVYKLSTSQGDFCIKLNNRTRFPGMFRKEANGLQFLANQTSFNIPEVIAEGAFDEVSFLLLSYIESAQKQSNFWSAFGMRLAGMHRVTQEGYGWVEDNYIGSLHQQNNVYPSWHEFFITQRIEPMLQQAIESGLMDSSFLKKWDRLAYRLEDLFPSEAPALLHGDLWSGNYMVDNVGMPALIDPAVYFGHREMDLAMTRLFGGFDSQMYRTYQESYPLEKGWEERTDLCNLYPILVHVNLFGSSYVLQAKRIIDQFT